MKIITILVLTVPTHFIICTNDWEEEDEEREDTLAVCKRMEKPLHRCAKNMEKPLHRMLLLNYSKSARPVKVLSDAVNVYIGLRLMQIIKLSESEQFIITKLWLRFEWVDEFLEWNPGDWERINDTRFNVDEVWTPDVYIVEDVGKTLSRTPLEYKTRLIVNHHGKTHWWVPVNLRSSCFINVERFPFDVQTCNFSFVSWTHNKRQMDFKVMLHEPSLTDGYLNSSLWTIRDITTRRVEVNYPCCPMPYVNIVASLTIQRKPLYYVSNIVVPCIVQMVIVVSTFFLPPGSGERIGVVVTVLLVFALYLEIIGDMLPKSSTSTPALMLFYRVIMMESAFALLTTCFVLSLHFKGTGTGVKPMHRYVRFVFLQCIAPIVCLRGEKKNRVANEFFLKNALTKMGLHFLTSSVPEDNNNKKDDVIKDCGINAVVDEVRTITSAIHDDCKEKEILEEWQLLANVFDRIFAIMFLIIFVISSCAILLAAVGSD